MEEVAPLEQEVESLAMFLPTDEACSHRWSFALPIQIGPAGKWETVEGLSKPVFRAHDVSPGGAPKAPWPAGAQIPQATVPRAKAPPRNRKSC